MALMKGADIPKDAVRMEEVDAVRYIWDIVNNWDSLSDTWALRYTPMVLGSVNALSGIILNNYYRHKLKLGSYGYMSSVLPITVMPCVLTVLFHRHIISTSMLLMKDQACPICYELKSAVVQLSLGIAYPIILAPTSALMFANRYSTFRVPNLLEGPKVVYPFLRKLSKPLGSTIMVLTTLQLAASSVLTYFEMKNNLTLRRKLLEIENKVMADSELESNY